MNEPTKKPTLSEVVTQKQYLDKITKDVATVWDEHLQPMLDKIGETDIAVIALHLALIQAAGSVAGAGHINSPAEQLESYMDCIQRNIPAHDELMLAAIREAARGQ